VKKRKCSHSFYKYISREIEKGAIKVYEPISNISFPPFSSTPAQKFYLLVILKNWSKKVGRKWNKISFLRNQEQAVDNFCFEKSVLKNTDIIGKVIRTSGTGN
jgi:hypothetical protein